MRRPHHYWPDSSNLYCATCALPRDHPIHQVTAPDPDPRREKP